MTKNSHLDLNECNTHCNLSLEARLNGLYDMTLAKGFAILGITLQLPAKSPADAASMVTRKGANPRVEGIGSYVTWQACAE